MTTQGLRDVQESQNYGTRPLLFLGQPARTQKMSLKSVCMNKGLRQVLRDEGKRRQDIFISFYLEGFAWTILKFIHPGKGMREARESTKKFQSGKVLLVDFIFVHIWFMNWIFLTEGCIGSVLLL